MHSVVEDLCRTDNSSSKPAFTLDGWQKSSFAKKALNKCLLFV